MKKRISIKAGSGSKIRIVKGEKERRKSAKVVSRGIGKMPTPSHNYFL